MNGYAAVMRLQSTFLKPIHLPTTIEHWLIKELQLFSANARMHSAQQVAQVVKSIQEFGWTNPILVGADNVIIASRRQPLGGSLTTALMPAGLPGWAASASLTSRCATWPSGSGCARSRCARKRARWSRADEVEAAWSALVLNAKSRLLQLGDELSDALACSPDRVHCKKLIDDKVYEILNELARSKHGQ
jgi:hypothetical protein